MKVAKSSIAGRYVVMVVCGLVIAFPLIFMVSRSLMSPQEIAAFPPHILPTQPDWGNYLEAYKYLTPRVIANSFIVATGIVMVQLVLTLPAAFALSKIPFRWTPVVLAVLVIPMFVPANFTLIPTFVVTYQLGLLNSYAGIILPIGGQIAFGVILFRQFFVTLPAGLVEAARIDGASWFRVFWSVTLPLARPVLATFCSLTFLTAWNLYIWPQVIATDPALAVINVALAPIAGGSSYVYVSPAIGLAGATLGMLPTLLLFVVMQRWYVRGISAGTGLE
jgi:ABC-type glycerol-3-phosphate transport system permease component